MRKLILKHREHWADRGFFLSSIGALIFFGASVVVSTLANDFVVSRERNPVTDIILNNVRVFDVDFIVNYGPLVICLLVIAILFHRPSAIPFTIKGVALFIIIRACFISLTHLGQFEPQLVLPTTGFLNFLGGGNTGGLFFSGHTGVPFFLALVFWDNRMLRWIFVTLSLVLGTCMLLGHLHYTIDVAGAFFITPTIYYLAQKFFKRDHDMLHQGLVRNA